MVKQPDFARAWFAQQRAGHEAVEAVEQAELRALDERTARAQSDALLSLGAASPMPVERVVSSGFIEQQRLFTRARLR